jgi:1,4-dihydroxy-2-naphthoate octaprenyltransferase
VATPREWIGGARPRTLPAAVVPVLVGSAVGEAEGRVILCRAGLALVVSLALQIGVNYANDYSDGVRGSDTVRIGPTRLVAGGLASPRRVRTAALLSFAVAAVAGLVLAILTTPVLIGVGVLAIAAAWFYTGGPRPYGYAGYGELFVFVFFGLVAVVGSAYVSLGRLTALEFLAAVPVGLLATGMLVVNNLRDIDGDRRVGKATLAVRLGESRTRVLYSLLILGPFVALLGIAILWRRPSVLLALVALPLAGRAIREVSTGASGKELIALLGTTGMLQLAFGGLFAIGLLL